MVKAKITEIFQSIQGEGIYQGAKQVFVRFYGCNLECKFCDTKLTQYNELNASELISEIKKFNEPFHSVSITGGEPLVQVDFLKEFLPLLKSEKIKIYLETNGTLPYALKDIISYVDIIAMDFKLPTSTDRAHFWDRHKGFLEIAKEKEVFIKAVICDSTTVEDINTAIDLVKEFDRDIPFILQPNSFELPINGVMQKAIYFQEHCAKSLQDVRIINQLHKLAGVR